MRGSMSPAKHAVKSSIMPLASRRLGRETAGTFVNQQLGPRSCVNPAARGLSAELMEALHWKEPQTPQPGSVADRLIRGEDVISIADLAEEGLRKSPHVQTLARVSGARSYLALALRRDERLLGIIAIHRNEVLPFTDKQIALLQN